MQYDFETQSQEVRMKTEGMLSYPIAADLSDSFGSDVSPASFFDPLCSVVRQDLGAIVTLLPSMVWSSSVPGRADEIRKGYDVSEIPMYCITSGPSLISSDGVLSIISLGCSTNVGNCYEQLKPFNLIDLPSGEALL